MNTPYSHAEDALAHHAANTAAVAIPVASVIFRLPEILTMIVSFLGIVWYGILIFDWVSRKVASHRQLKQSADRVAVPILDERHVPDDASPPSD